MTKTGPALKYAHNKHLLNESEMPEMGQRLVTRQNKFPPTVSPNFLLFLIRLETSRKQSTLKFSQVFSYLNRLIYKEGKVLSSSPGFFFF